MSNADAKHMVRRCFTEEMEGLDNSFQTHREAMESYKVCLQFLDYLWKSNREIYLMAENSNFKVFESRKKSFYKIDN